MHGILRSAWDEPRPPNAPARLWWDWALVGLFASAALLEGLLRPELHWRGGAVLLTAGLAVTLLWRRSRPLLVVGIAFGFCAISSVVQDHPMEMNTMLFMLMIPYALFRWGSGQEAAFGLPIILGNIGVAVLLDGGTVAETVAGFAVISAACALGAAVRFRSAARVRELDRIKLLERERLARDLHDTVAHHVSAIVIRAQAGLATSSTQTGAAADALRVIEAEASHTLTEMRGMVRVLRRNEPVELAPNPGITDIERLANGDRPGPAVDVRINGEFDDLPPSVAAAIFRLAQESVTNARRHARHATRIDVQVAADDTAVQLRVSDDGDTSAIRSNGTPGFGLVGMIERAQLLGGTCQAGPDAHRGWTVTATLPRAGWATA